MNEAAKKVLLHDDFPNGGVQHSAVFIRRRSRVLRADSIERHDEFVEIPWRCDWRCAFKLHHWSQVIFAVLHQSAAGGVAGDAGVNQCQRALVPENEIRAKSPWRANARRTSRG